MYAVLAASTAAEEALKRRELQRRAAEREAINQSRDVLERLQLQLAHEKAIITLAMQLKAESGAPDSLTDDAWVALARAQLV